MVWIGSTVMVPVREAGSHALPVVVTVYVHTVVVVTPVVRVPSNFIPVPETVPT